MIARSERSLSRAPADARRPPSRATTALGAGYIVATAALTASAPFDHGRWLVAYRGASGTRGWRLAPYALVGGLAASVFVGTGLAGGLPWQ